MLFLLINAACAMDETKTEDSKLTETTSTEETNKRKYPPVMRTVEEIINQKVGVLAETHLDQTLETLGSWEYQQYQYSLGRTFNPIVERELTAYFTNHQNLSGEQVYDPCLVREIIKLL